MFLVFCGKHSVPIHISLNVGSSRVPAWRDGFPRDFIVHKRSRFGDLVAFFGHTFCSATDRRSQVGHKSLSLSLSLPPPPLLLFFGDLLSFAKVCFSGPNFLFLIFLWVVNFQLLVQKAEFDRDQLPPDVFDDNSSPNTHHDSSSRRRRRNSRGGSSRGSSQHGSDNEREPDAALKVNTRAYATVSVSPISNSAAELKLSRTPTESGSALVFWNRWFTMRGVTVTKRSRHELKIAVFHESAGTYTCIAMAIHDSSSLTLFFEFPDFFCFLRQKKNGSVP